jgi:hypothetical protein
MTTALPFAVLLAVASTAPSPGGDATTLVGRVVTAYGGAARLAAHGVLVQEGEVTAHVSADVGRFTRILARPLKLRVAIRYPGGATERRVLDGPRGWRDGREVTGSPPWIAMVLQAARMDLPYLLSQGGKHVVDGGTVERNGATMRVLSLPIGDGMSVSAEIDPASGRILRAVGRLAHGQVSLEFVTEYSAFREIDGALMAFQEESYVQGRHTGTTTLKSAEFLPEEPTGAFQP